MSSAPASHSKLRLSTELVSPHERTAVAREVFGREVLNLDLEPDPDTPLHVDYNLQSFPDLKIVTGTSEGVMSHRSRAMLADGNDDLLLSLNETEVFSVKQRGREALLLPGDAALISCAEPAAFRRAKGRAIGLRVPRTLFAHLPGVIEDRVALLIPATSEPLRLLRAYVNSIDARGGPATAELCHMVVSHIHDLLMLAVSGMDAMPEQALGRGLKAARLRQIKSHIGRELTGDLSIGAVAGAHHLTKRYVQRLFEEEGTTFSTFVGQQRLARAYRMLRDPRQAGRAVKAVAYDCGFGDITHFNRLFRRLYGVTPTEVRAGQTASSDSGNGGV